MDIKTLKLNGKVMIFSVCVCCFGGLYSCSSKNSKDEVLQSQRDLTVIKERMKATELAFEYEQFVNRMWRELNLLSDSLTDLQANYEVRPQKNRKQKMASIEKSLRELEVRLKEAESNTAFNEADGKAIKELRDAIKRKDTIIRELKSENSFLRDKNIDLSKQLEMKETELSIKESDLRIKEQDLNEKERQLYFQKKLRAEELEIMGDNLRKIVIRMGNYRGTGAYENYKASQIKLLEISINCYEQANILYPSQGFREKIKLTRYGMEKYRNTKDLTGLVF